MSSNNLKEGARRTGDGSSVLGRRLAHAEACAERLVYESEVREGKEKGKGSTKQFVCLQKGDKSPK